MSYMFLHASAIGATRVRSPASSTSCRAAGSSSGWLRRSASPLASRGMDNAINCIARRRALANNTRICVHWLVAASIAAAAGSQSPLATTG
eukprot:6185965-Pleurochrysis_carterae.AAC.4